MSTASERGEEFISHYGVRGMRWGIRKAEGVSTTVRTDQGLIRRKTKIEAKGGEAQPASNDAVKAAVQRQKLKKSGAAALSNQELRDLATRLQLEQQVQALTTKKGQKFIQKELEEEGKRAAKKKAVSAAPHVVRKVRRGAAVAATTAALL
jgi:preprotein translocase subunit SecF